MHTADGRPIGGGIVGPSTAYWLSESYAPVRALNDAGQKSY
jgi:L-2-hydroxyglutarate oxidase LhgO